MKNLLVIFFLLFSVRAFASTVVYDDAPQTVTDKIIEVRPGTVNALSAVTGMTDGFKYTVNDGTTMVDCDTSSCPSCGGGIHKVECCYDESQAAWEACHPGINPTAYPVILTTIPNFAGRGLAVGADSKSIYLLPEKYTSDPCGTLGEGEIFYNDTSNYFCYCDGTNDVKLHDPATACF